MLNERELRALARIEQHLVETDPDLVQLFHRRVPVKNTSESVARTMLVIGTALLMLGSVASLLPLALFGAVVAVIALWLAYLAGTVGRRRSRLS